MELRQAENGVFYIHWTEGRRSKRVSTRTRDLAAAKTFFGQWLLLSETGTEQSNLTTGDLYSVYHREHVAKKTVSPGGIEYAWKNLEPAFALLRPRDITQTQVDEYELDRKAGRIGRPSKSSTVWRELTVLKAVWRYGAKRKLIELNEVPAIELPDPPEARQRWLVDAEIEKLFAAAEQGRNGERLSRAERFLWLALETGARRRVIETLKWDQVDFETGVIHYGIPSARRTTKRSASVPISDGLRPVLERAFKEKTGALVLDNTSPIYPSIRTVARHAGVKGVSPHVLRHTAATHMARAGVPIWKIAGVLGNTVQMVAAVYAKHSPDTLREAVNAIRSTRRGGHLKVVE
jgi:integrase